MDETLKTEDRLPPDTLIGKKIGKIASTVYGSRSYLTRMRDENETPKWIGVNCCDYHKHWTKTLSGNEASNFCIDEPIITHETIRQGLGLAILPCHMGDQDPDLARYMEPLPEMDVDLWLLFHSDLKRTVRVTMFRDFIAAEFETMGDLLEGRLSTG